MTSLMTSLTRCPHHHPDGNQASDDVTPMTSQHMTSLMRYPHPHPDGDHRRVMTSHPNDVTPPPPPGRGPQALSREESQYWNKYDGDLNACRNRLASAGVSNEAKSGQSTLRKHHLFQFQFLF